MHVAGNDFEIIFQWNLLSAWCPRSYPGNACITSFLSVLSFKISYTFFFLVQVLIAVVSNLIWYGSLAPSVQENDHVSISLWRGFTVVVSSLAIFGRLFFNSAQVRLVMRMTIHKVIYQESVFLIESSSNDSVSATISSYVGPYHSLCHHHVRHGVATQYLSQYIKVL